MGSTVWAITGFKNERFDRSFNGDILRDEVVGEPNYTTGTIGKICEPTKTVMHGAALLGHGKPRGYSRLKVSLQTMEEFENIPIAERGLGAMCGGYISVKKLLPLELQDKKTAEDVQAWGVIDKSKAKACCGFYGSAGPAPVLYTVMVCFSRTNVAPVSGFWRNGEAIIGPDIKSKITDWGLNIKCKYDTGNFGIALAEVTSTVVLQAEFPELLADLAGATVEPQNLCPQVFTNDSSATMTGYFNLKTTLLDTHTLVFEEGSGVDWSARWKAKVPLLSNAKSTVEIEVSFGAHQFSTTSKTQDIDRSAKIELPPMAGCTATARYMKSVLDANAALTVQKTYTNGYVVTCQVPAKYTSVSFDKAEIKLEGTPAGPASVPSG